MNLHEMNLYEVRSHGSYLGTVIAENAGLARERANKLHGASEKNTTITLTRRMPNHDRYLRIVQWAKRRYSDSNGTWVRCVGNGIAGQPSPDGRAFMVPSLYSVIEDLAAARYLGVRRTWQSFSIATAYRQETAA